MDPEKIEALKSVPSATLSRLPMALVLTNPRHHDNPIVYSNAAFEQLTGYPASSIVGQNCRFLQGEGTEDAVLEEIRTAVTKARDVSVVLTNYRADGSSFRNRLSITPIRNDENGEVELFLGTQREAQDGEENDAGLMTELAELQHRVKNHLAMIVGFIRLQARGETAVEDYHMLARRVEALQLLYQELDDTGASGATTVSLGAYVSRIAAAIGHLDGRAGIRSDVSTEEIEVDVTIATRIGLLLSEVLTNAFQHAFEGRDQGAVETKLEALGPDAIRITVSDDGIGIPEGAGWPAEGGNGSQIVLALMRGLHAKHKVETSPDGTRVAIEMHGLEP